MYLDSGLARGGFAHHLKWHKKNVQAASTSCLSSDNEFAETFEHRGFASFVMVIRDGYND